MHHCGTMLVQWLKLTKLSTNMELRIKLGTVGYNNKILVSYGKFNLGKNDEVNSLKTPAISHKDPKPKQTQLSLIKT